MLTSSLCLLVQITYRTLRNTCWSHITVSCSLTVSCCGCCCCCCFFTLSRFLFLTGNLPSNEDFTLLVLKNSTSHSPSNEDFILPSTEEFIPPGNEEFTPPGNEELTLISNEEFTLTSNEKFALHRNEQFLPREFNLLEVNRSRLPKNKSSCP